jgi:hypothetical protein
VENFKRTSAISGFVSCSSRTRFPLFYQLDFLNEIFHSTASTLAEPNNNLTQKSALCVSSRVVQGGNLKNSPLPSAIPLAILFSSVCCVDSVMLSLDAGIESFVTAATSSS